MMATAGQRARSCARFRLSPRETNFFDCVESLAREVMPSRVRSRSRTRRVADREGRRTDLHKG